jgi:hypothetical protein
VSVSAEVVMINSSNHILASKKWWKLHQVMILAKVVLQFHPSYFSLYKVVEVATSVGNS